MSGKRFLVVDDNPALRGLLQTYLERKGHAVETVENGRDALTRLDQAVYDAVLLDYMMSEVTGLSVLRHVRQHHPSLPVMMMTSERYSHVAAASFVALGARGCLFKPFDPQDLEQIIQMLVTVPVAKGAAASCAPQMMPSGSPGRASLPPQWSSPALNSGHE